ncbi:MAG TPA: ATP-binding protein [Polyangiaceae bacterium]|nr:ATP-binding protein [Polyangiaceae bacterium]
MIIARKLLAYLVTGMLLVLGISSYLRVQREISLFQTDMEADHRLLGRAMAAAVARVWRIDGANEAIALVTRISRLEPLVHARWIWQDDLKKAPGAEQLSQGERDALAEARTFRARTLVLSDRMVTYVGVSVPGSRHGVLELEESLAPRDGYVRATIVNTTVTTLLIAGVCGLLASAMGLSLVGNPVRQLVRQARRVGAGDLAAHSDLPQKDELGELAREMNAMCDRLVEARVTIKEETEARIDALEQLRHADRLVTVGRLASGLAHELGTPLNVIGGRAKMIERNPSQEEAASSNARIIREQADRVTQIVRQLLDFARAGVSSKHRARLEETAVRAVALLAPMAGKRNVKLQIVTEPELPEVEIDAAQMQQVVSNLIVNAIQAMEQAGEVTVGLARKQMRPPNVPEASEREYVSMEVRDQGVGIAAQHLPRIFEPFFTTKGVGEGTGLGLSVAYGIIHEHGGFITVESTPGAGSRFTVYLPVVMQS